MARLVFPDEGSRLVYQVATGVLRALAGATTVQVWANQAGTVLPDLQPAPGYEASLQTGGKLLVDDYSRLPLWYGPDGVDTLWVQVSGGPITPVYARADDRIDQALTTAAAALPAAGGTVSGRLAIDRHGAPAGYPVGQAGTVDSLNVPSSYAGGDDDGTGTDSTGRINLYSYQRANSGSFGENIRNFAMRADAKTMQAFYVPVQSTTKTGGYDPTTRNPMSSGISWKPVVWQGAHYEANDHASVHGHWELEIADLTGALQGRLEIPFIDQATDSTKALDQVPIGVAYTNIRTNLADLSVRAQNMTAGPYSGQNTAFRVGGNNAVNKDILLSISSDMGTVGRRWGIRATNETESGGNAGTNFQLNRYDDTGTFQDSPVVVSRSTGNVTLGPGIVARRASPTVSSFSLNSTSLGGGVGVVALGNVTTAPASNPTGGIVMYVSNGRLKIRQPDGIDQFVALTAT